MSVQGCGDIEMLAVLDETQQLEVVQLGTQPGTFGVAMVIVSVSG
ncbi:MAG: hypothetical protein ACRDRA_12495 [Pseudonocardiaceae bacterium]